MITKGIVEQIDRNNPYTAKVRIPVFNKAQGVVGATPTNQLYTASICCLPNCNPNIKVGDVVYVSFEDNYIDKPIILGHLYNGVSNLNTTVGLKTDSVEATVTARLPADTNIGNTTPNDFVNLQGTKSQLQGQIDEIVSQYNSLDNKVDIVTAPKPWINGTKITKIQFLPNEQEIAVHYAYSTNNLLYIETANVEYAGSYTSDLINVNFLLNKSNVDMTEDLKTFESYFNKKWRLISAYTLANPKEGITTSVGDSNRYILYADKTNDTNDKAYSFMLSLNPEYYYHQYSKMILSEVCKLQPNQPIDPTSWTFTLTLPAQSILSIYGYDTTYSNMIRIYPVSGWTLSKDDNNVYTITYGDTIAIAESAAVSYLNTEGQQPDVDRDSRYGFLFALSD